MSLINHHGSLLGAPRTEEEHKFGVQFLLGFVRLWVSRLRCEHAIAESAIGEGTSHLNLVWISLAEVKWKSVLCLQRLGHCMQRDTTG